MDNFLIHTKAAYIVLLIIYNPTCESSIFRLLLSLTHFRIASNLGMAVYCKFALHNLNLYDRMLTNMKTTCLHHHHIKLAGLLTGQGCFK